MLLKVNLKGKICLEGTTNVLLEPHIYNKTKVLRSDYDLWLQIYEYFHKEAFLIFKACSHLC